MADPAGNLLHRLGLPAGGQPLQRDPDRPDPHPRHHRDPGRLGRRRPVRPAASAAVADHRRLPGHRGRHDLAAGPGPGPRGHLAVDTGIAAVRRRDRGHADRLGQRGPVQLPRQRSGRDLRPVPQRLQPGILTRHRPGRLGPGRRQTARGQAIRRRPHHDARDHPHRPGPRRPHPPQANRGHGTGKSRRGTCGLATDTVMPCRGRHRRRPRAVRDRPARRTMRRASVVGDRATQWTGQYDVNQTAQTPALSSTSRYRCSTSSRRSGTYPPAYGAPANPDETPIVGQAAEPPDGITPAVTARHRCQCPADRRRPRAQGSPAPVRADATSIRTFAGARNEGRP